MNVASPQLEGRLLRPESHLARMDFEYDRLEFIELSRDDCARLNFVDRADADTGRTDRWQMDMQSAREHLARRAAGSQSPINYIFHTSFCCSTLLSRALDAQGKSFALKEPAVFTDLASYKRHLLAQTSDTQRWPGLLDLGIGLSGRPFVNGESVLIKPGNVANNLLDDVLVRTETGGVILLYSSLEKFLVSVLKKGEPGRSWARDSFAIVAHNAPQVSHLSPQYLMRLTDLQIAALTWQIQIENYLRILQTFPDARIRTLDCDVLLADPGAVLKRAAAFMGCPLDDDEIQTRVECHFRRHSKEPERDYDAVVRAQEYDETAALHRDDIDMILQWSEQLRPDMTVPRELPRAL